MMEQIGDTWWFFRDLTEGKPCVIIGEGNAQQPASTDSYEEIMTQVNGEQSVLRKLALDHGIEFISPDTGYPEAHLLPATFSIEDAVLYYFMRNGPQVHRSGAAYDETTQSYLQTRLKELEEALCTPPDSHFRGFNFTYDNITRLYEARYHKPFTTHDGEFLAEETVGHLFHPERPPSPNESKVSLVSREVNKLRRENLLRLYKRLWGEGKSIYSIFGEPHIIELEEELCALGKPTQTIYNMPITPRDVALGKIILSNY
jgi:hypothetical protein